MINLLISFFLLANLNGEDMKPPIAQKITYKMEKHGDTRIDNYFWMRERDSKNVLDYLKAENEYTKYQMSDTKLQKKLFKELKSRVKEDDESTPVKYKNYTYFRKFLKGKDYPIYYRRRIENNKMEKLIDVNEIAVGKEFLPFNICQDKSQ